MFNFLCTSPVAFSVRTAMLTVMFNIISSSQRQGYLPLSS